jgi:hypothetical protein
MKSHQNKMNADLLAKSLASLGWATKVREDDYGYDVFQVVISSHPFFAGTDDFAIYSQCGQLDCLFGGPTDEAQKRMLYSHLHTLSYAVPSLSKTINAIFDQATASEFESALVC